MSESLPTAQPVPHAYQALLAAGVVAGVFEGFQGFAAAMNAGSTMTSALLAFWEVLGTVALPVALLAAPVGYALDRPVVRALARAVKRAFTGDADERSATVAVLAGMLVVGGSVGAAAWVEWVVRDRLGVNIALAFMVLAAVSAFAELFIVVGRFTRALTPRLVAMADAKGRGREFLAGGLGPAITAVAIVMLALLPFLPLRYVITAFGFALGLAVTLVEPGRHALARTLAGKRGPVVLVATILVGLSAPVTLSRLPPDAGHVVRCESPVASALLAACPGMR